MVRYRDFEIATVIMFCKSIKKFYTHKKSVNMLTLYLFKPLAVILTGTVIITLKSC